MQFARYASSLLQIINAETGRRSLAFAAYAPGLGSVVLAIEAKADHLHEKAGREKQEFFLRNARDWKVNWIFEMLR